MRLFAWSDLHVDYPTNRRLLEQVSRHDYQDGALLVAGDVSNDPAKLLRTLELLKTRFAEVAFVPGNHDLWVSGGGRIHSLEKLHGLRAVCRANQIRVDPFDVSVESQIVRIIPLISWYLKPEEEPGSLFIPKPGEDPSLSMWADNKRIQWPALPGGRSPARHLLPLNPKPSSGPAPLTVTFSHFLPRVELVFCDGERIRREGRARGVDPHPKFNFTRVAGCRQLDEQLRNHRAQVHLYGHQHRNRDRVIDGVRYVSHCLGYPAEWQAQEAAPPRMLPLEIRLNAG